MFRKKYVGVLVLTAVVLFAGKQTDYAKNNNVLKQTTQETKEKNTKEDTVQKGLYAGVEALLENDASALNINVTKDSTNASAQNDAAQDTEQSQAENSRAVQVKSQENDSKESKTHWGYTNLGIAHVENSLNIRKEPSEKGKIIGKLSKNAACEILEVADGWAHMKSGKVEGYCSTDYLYMGEEAIEAGKKAASLIAVVNTETLKVREQPSTDCAVITLIPREEELEVEEVMDNGWVKFLLDDEEAYVSGEYVDVEERLEKAVSTEELVYGQGISDTRVSLVQYAKQFIGNPYVWGGTSLTKGADCSGFTMQIFAKYGVNLPHHAASQAQSGTKVTLAEAKPGDLVFYAKNGNINHVGIYIGNGQIVHASTPKTGIKISNVGYRTPAVIKRYL